MTGPQLCLLFTPPHADRLDQTLRSLPKAAPVGADGRSEVLPPGGQAASAASGMCALFSRDNSDC